MSAYFTFTSPLVRDTLARGEAINAVFASLEAAFDKLPSEAELKQDRTAVGVDSGAADAYVVTLTYVPASYTTAMGVMFVPQADNTGASTINVNGLGVKAIVRFDGSALAAGDIPAGGVVEVRYDGTRFRLMNGNVRGLFPYTPANKAGETFTGSVAVQGTLTATTWGPIPFASITGNVPITQGGTGQTSAAAALTALLPAQAGQSGKVLATNGTAASWVAAGAGTVSSIVAGAGLSGGTITTTGTIDIADTGVPAGAYGSANQVAAFVVNSRGQLTDAGSHLIAITGAQVSGDIAGNAGGLTNTLGINKGGTGQTTANAALNAFLPAQAGQSGKFLTTDGTNTSWGSPSGVGTVTNIATGAGLTGGPITTTGTIALAASGVSSGTYGGSANLPVLTFDAYGRATSATSVAIAIDAGQITSGALPIARGGTGQVNAANALFALGGVAKAGDTITGLLVVNKAGDQIQHQSAGANTSWDSYYYNGTVIGFIGTGGVGSGTETDFTIRAESNLRLAIGGTTQGWFNATGLGIGTTPSYALHVVRAGSNSEWRNSGGAGTFKLITGGGFTTLGTVTNDPLVFVTNDTERGRINAAGSMTWNGNITAGSFTGPLTGNATNVSGVVALANGGLGASHADAAAVRTTLGIGSMATRALTISTSAPSGGADGDVWFRY